MRKKIILSIVLILTIVTGYFIYEAVFVKAKIITNLLNSLILSIGLISSVLLYFSTANKSFFKPALVITVALFICVIYSFIDTNILFQHWNLLFSLLLLLSGICLITSLQKTNLITKIVIGATTLFLEAILLFQVENAIYFSIIFFLLIALTALSLLAVFSSK